MSNFKLNLPTDIPWERICVTEDMIDKVVCDNRLPAKWQTSMAVFKYVPEDEFQLYPKYKISYLKVTATITGYQPLDQEIQGRIDWDGVDVSTIPGLTDLLNSYNPCHGAILQVVVGPHGRKPNIPLDQYPFFLDFEPKKRELYELATDTKEKQSRSIESLNVTKSTGTTQSMEILDVDMGGGGFGAQASYAGTGGGFTYTAPNGQWGTKRLNAEESLASRSSDVGQEKRETFSFSTQISQMYHLLDSYHLGTNRVVFFVQPRPHTLEEPSGFVRGPRPVEGIQEFFLVVAQPKDQEEFCVSLRLDTSHLTKVPIMEFDRKSETTSMASCSAPVASSNDIPAENIVGATACVPAPWPFEGCIGDAWDVHYQCYRTEAHDNVTYNAPPGYRIESTNTLVDDKSHGTTQIVVTPNGASLNINVSANGHKCYEGSEVCLDCPDTIQAWAGHARMQVQVNLVSTEPIKQVGEEEVLMITTRGLCCCSDDQGHVPVDELVVDVRRIPDVYSINKYLKAKARISEKGSDHEKDGHACQECSDKIKRAQEYTNYADAKQVIRIANDLGNYIKTETIRSLNDPTLKLKKFADTDFFAKQLEYRMVQNRRGRNILGENVSKDIPKEVLSKIEKYLKKSGKDITRRDVLSLRGELFAKLSGIKPKEAQELKLTMMGLKFNPEKPKKDDDDRKGKSAK